MEDLAADVVVVARGSRWVRLRVRGLLRNAELAARIHSRRPAGAPACTISLATGSVRVELDGAATELAWVRVLLGCVAAEVPAARGEGPAVVPPAPARAAARNAARASAPARPRGGGAAAQAPSASPPVTDGAHAIALAELLRRLGAGRPLDPRRGLGAADAAARLARDGRNEIRDVTGRSAGQILLDQFESVPVALLGASAGLALSTRAYADAAAIGAVLAANSGLGFVTEKRAEETVSSLRKLAPRQATVIRDGRPLQVDSRDIVVGDMLVLRPGEPVAADARVVEAHRLAANEAALTGESLPVKKHAHDRLPPATPLGERSNMVFLGTVVSGGAGTAVVVATAERAALGRIRELAQHAQAPRTRLQVELDMLGRRLAIGAAVLCAGVFAIGALRARPLLPLLRTAVALGVAAIPEGLPTVATSLLAASIRSLRERQVYARRLDAVENLGAVDTVCFDKTGTLTHNRMSVASLTLGLELVTLDDPATAPALPAPWLRVAVLCNSVGRAEAAAGVEGDGGAPRWQGSSTELALVEYAQARGADVAALRRSHPLLGVRQRSEHHPYMVTLHDSADHGLLVAVKGRPDEVLARCEAWHDGQQVQRLGHATRGALLALNDRLAARGERVLALAYRQHPNQAYGETGGLCWLGLVGLADPLRPELPAMMARFRAAGIRPLMITGDQLGTARAVAERIGLAAGEQVVDAGRLPEQADALLDIAERASGFARTSPAMKLEIVRALQQRGHVVAMTGDGINDGPALKTADVGVAMGVTGTDFAHAMSDLVLRDDHPAALLGAIAQGRTTFLNIQKSVRYLVTTNLSELAATTIAVAAGLPEPFDPLALLWTNIVTDIWPAIALGLEPPEPGVLERPPVALEDGLLGRQDWGAVATDTGVMTLAALASFGFGLARYGDSPQARTLAFMTLTSSQLLYALAARSSRPLVGGGLQPNRMLGHAVGWSLLAQTGTLALPFMRRLLRTAPIGPLDLLVAVAAATAPLVVREVLKRRALAATGSPR